MNGQREAFKIEPEQLVEIFVTRVPRRLCVVYVTRCSLPLYLHIYMEI